MKALVTGATGFLGGYVIEELLKNNINVVASSSDETKAKKASWYKQVLFIPHQINQIQVERDLFEYFLNPDILIHLAWQGLPNYKSSDHIDDNLFPQYAFLKNLIRNGLKDLTITGTCLEYGMQQGSLNENLQVVPSNAYSIAKDCLRRLVDVLKNDYAFHFKWVRLFYMYGKGQNPKSLIPLLERAIENKEPEFNMSGGEQIRDYLPAEKVAENIVRVAMQSAVTGIVNCCSGDPITVLQLVEKIKKEKNSTIKLNLGHYPYSDYEPMSFWGDRTKLDKILHS